MVNNLANPNPLLFMLAVLRQFVDPSRGPVAAQLLVLGTTQKVSGLAILGTVAITAGTLGTGLARKPQCIRWQRRLAGSVMVAIGALLIV